MRNFKDESFIAQYLSPKLIRDFCLFAVADHAANDHLRVDSIHDDDGYRRVRQLLALQHHYDVIVPDTQVANHNRNGDRSLTLRHQVLRGRPLAGEDAERVLKHLGRLWGFTVRLESVGADGRSDSKVREGAPAQGTSESFRCGPRGSR